MGGAACWARTSPYAALRLETTRTMRASGRAGVSWASMRAWRLEPFQSEGLSGRALAGERGGAVPEPEMRTVMRRWRWCAMGKKKGEWAFLGVEDPNP